MPVGPQIPPHSDDDDDEEIGPQPSVPSTRTTGTHPSPAARRAIGPSLPPPNDLTQDDDDDDDDDSSEDEIGPQPLPSLIPHSSSSHHSDGVREFMEREARRRKLAEDAAKPKKLQREEWMLVPPSSTGVLGSLDPSKFKARQFSRSSSSSTAKKTDNSLWTETPAERQQRIADEVSGKKRRAANAEETLTPEEALESRKKQRKDAEIKESVEEHTRKLRGSRLVDMHAKSSSSTKDVEEEYSAIWDHGRDMSIGGRLLDDSARNRMIKDAQGLGDRFGHGKQGTFL